MRPLSVDRYLAWRFHLRKSNCWHIVRAGWLELTGNDIGDRTPATITAATLNRTFDVDVPTFRKLADPISPCIVLMVQRGAVPHVGLYYRGRVLQMTMRGASYMPLGPATAGYRVEFYAP